MPIDPSPQPEFPPIPSGPFPASREAARDTATAVRDPSAARGVPIWTPDDGDFG